MHYARGKTLGGSSARNFLYYHRQTVGSSEKWAAEIGDPSFTFPNLLPFYEKTVHYTAPDIQYPNSTNDQDASVFSANGGPLQVSFGGYNDPFATWVLPALQAVGQAAIKGFQNGVLLGSAYIPATLNPKNASRSSSESSFLQSALRNTTLKVYNNTCAEASVYWEYSQRCLRFFERRLWCWRSKLCYKCSRRGDSVSGDVSIASTTDGLGNWPPWNA